MTMRKIRRMPLFSTLMLQYLWISLVWLPHLAHGFASYLLNDVGCRTYLENDEVIMNHLVQDPITDAPLYIELVPPANVEFRVQAMETTDNGRPHKSHRKVVIQSNDKDHIMFPLEFDVRVVPISSDVHPGDYQFVLQLGEESDATFPQGSCEQHKRVAGRPTEAVNVQVNQLNDMHPLELWGAWAAGHEPVKLLQGYEFVVSTPTSDADAPKIPGNKDENNNKDNMSWEFYVLQDAQACQDDAAIADAGIHVPYRTIRGPAPSLPRQLEVVEETEPSNPQFASRLMIGWPEDALSLDQLGHVALHVVTTDVEPSEKVIHPAKWSSGHSVCEGKRLLLPHLNDFPLSLDIPHQEHSDHVVVTVHAIYDLLKEHDNSSAPLYRIEPLELHWEAPTRDVKAESEMSWEYFVLQDLTTCQNKNGFTIPRHVKSVQAAKEPWPTKLALTEETNHADSDAAALYKIDWPKHVDKEKLGHVLLHVTTLDVASGEDTLVHAAKIVSSHAVCDGRRLLLPHVQDFPLTVTLPFQPHSQHVTISVDVLYDLADEHDREDAPVYKTEALKVEWKAPLINLAAESKMSWEYFALQDQKSCNATHIDVPGHVKVVKEAVDPLLTRFEVHKKSMAANSFAEYDIGWPADTAIDQLGHVLVHVATESPKGKPVHPARWSQGDHGVCDGKRMLLPHIGAFPLLLDIPQQPDEDVVIITVSAVYDLHEEHGLENASLYRIQPLKFEFRSTDGGKEQLEKQKHEQRMIEADEEDRLAREARKQHLGDRARDVSEEEKQRQRAEERKLREQEKRKREKEHDEERRREREAHIEEHKLHPDELKARDPQRTLDESIQKDLRKHLDELQQKEDRKKRRTLDSADRVHGALDFDREPNNLHDVYKRHRHNKDHIDLGNGSDDKSHKRHAHHHLKHSHDKDDPNFVPVIMWQDSAYFMGLAILVGGIYGTIVVCTFLSKVYGDKPRQE